MTRYWAPEERESHEATCSGAPVVWRSGVAMTGEWARLVEQKDATVWFDPCRDVVVVREPGRPEVVVPMVEVRAAEWMAPFVGAYEPAIVRQCRVARQLAHEAWLRDGYRTPESEERAA